MALHEKSTLTHLAPVAAIASKSRFRSESLSYNILTVPAMPARSRFEPSAALAWGSLLTVISEAAAMMTARTPAVSTKRIRFDMKSTPPQQLGQQQQRELDRR